MNTHRLRIESGYSHRTGGDHDTRTEFHVLIRDDVSGQAVAEFYLNRDTFLDFMSNNGTTYVDGELVDATFYHRVGKRMEHTSTEVRGHGTDIDLEAERIKEQYLAEGWEVASICRTNYGRHVTARKWVDAS